MIGNHQPLSDHWPGPRRRGSAQQQKQDSEAQRCAKPDHHLSFLSAHP
jgi:hypothetical protein